MRAAGTEGPPFSTIPTRWTPRHREGRKTRGDAHRESCYEEVFLRSGAQTDVSRKGTTRASAPQPVCQLSILAVFGRSSRHPHPTLRFWHRFRDMGYPVSVIHQQGRRWAHPCRASPPFHDGDQKMPLDVGL